MALPNNIRYLRKKQGWGQDILAEKLGYKSYTTIQKWESGVSDPPLKVVHELAALFNVDINDLTGSDLEAGSSINIKTLVNNDEELNEYLEVLKTRPEMRMLFQLSKDATKEDVEAAVRIIEALRNK